MSLFASFDVFIMRLFSHIWIVCFAFLFLACGKTSLDKQKKIPITSKSKKIDVGIDTDSGLTTALASPANPASQLEKEKPPVVVARDTLAGMLKQPLVARYSTLGMARYSLLFDAPIVHIQWSAHAGMSISSGKFVHNVTTKGDVRWKVNAGINHEIFLAEQQEVVWARQYGFIFQMVRQGRVGWRKDWESNLAFNPPDTVYLLDASNISKLSEDGLERWRVNVEGVRKLDGPFDCDEFVLFQGKRGQKSVATVISDKGTVVNEIELAFGSVVLGASFQCEPIVWSSGQVQLLNSRGDITWAYPLKNKPLFFRLYNTFVLVVPDAQEAVDVMMLDKQGNLLFKRALPIFGRVTDGKVLELTGLSQAIALCKDMSSPCAKGDGNRGPFNVVLTGERGKFSVLERLVKGHNNIEIFPRKGFVHVASSEENTTTVTMRDNQGQVRWDLTLPGRVSVGPYVGPYGGIYVGTCMGWECLPPYRLISITGAPYDSGDSNSAAIH